FSRREGDRSCLQALIQRISFEIPFALQRRPYEQCPASPCRRARAYRVRAPRPGRTSKTSTREASSCRSRENTRSAGGGGGKDAGYQSVRPLLHYFRRSLPPWDAVISNAPLLRRFGTVPERDSACTSSAERQLRGSRTIRPAL